MGVLTNIWEFTKRHWQAILLVVVIAGGYVWFKNQQASNAATIVQINESHQIELEKITVARALEEAQHKAQLERLQQSLEKIQQDYTQVQATIAAQQTAQQKQIVQKYSNDSVGLAKLLAGEFGFVVVLPPTQ